MSCKSIVRSSAKATLVRGILVKCDCELKGVCKLRELLNGMCVVMLAAWRSSLIVVMILEKTKLKSRSASGSPGLIPAVV